MSNAAAEVIGTIQAGHIDRHPDFLRDVAPASAAERREPMELHRSYDDLDTDDDDDIPYSALRPAKPATHGLPPMPDLRFEQSYLHSIAHADTWWKVALITAKDQFIFPMLQGFGLALIMAGWHHWNKSAQVGGSTVGGRVRRWWYGVNNWEMPKAAR